MGGSNSKAQNRQKKENEITHNEAVYASQNYSSDLNEAVSKVVGGPMEALYSDIGIRISCTNLPNTDANSITDPYVVAWISNSAGGWDSLGFTEVIQNSLNPQFITIVHAKYYFEEKQHLRFDVYDQDNIDVKNLQLQDFIGSVQCTLAELFSGKEREFSIVGNYGQGKMKIVCESMKNNRTQVTFNIALSKQNMFLVISKKLTSWAPAYKSSVSSGTNMNFTIKISAAMLYNDETQPILFELFSYKPAGDHVKIGETEAIISKLIEVDKIVINSKPNH